MTGGRFPGFRVLDQAAHWDPVTAGVVLTRVGIPPDIRFFTPAEEAAATALCDQLLGQDREPKIPVVQQIDSRLAEHETDGWRYDDMPEDGQAWRQALQYLDADCQARFSCDLAKAAAGDQRAVIQAVQDLGSKDWHGMVAAHVWSLWTRYACTAFYAHPSAWDEMGFPGPAYPRGYKNAAVDGREPFEVADIHPSDDPVAEDG
ncbi:MAG: gluconate 2-dehydrogenase subunit 3 family protein [Actinomycetota bacterium]